MKSYRTFSLIAISAVIGFGVGFWPMNTAFGQPMTPVMATAEPAELSTSSDLSPDLSGGGSLSGPSGSGSTGDTSGSLMSEEGPLNGGEGDDIVSDVQDGDDAGVTPIDKVSVVVVPSGQRYLKNNVSIIGNSSTELYCAKNEYEAFQIIVVNRSNYTISDIEIYVSDWQGPDGANPDLTLFREHYVRISKPTGQSRIERFSGEKKGEIGVYPDALIPFMDPYMEKPITKGVYQADGVSVKPKQSQGYWIDVGVDVDVIAGQYTCSILVTSSDKPLAEIPVTLTVWDFKLSRDQKLTAWFAKTLNLDGMYRVPKYSSAYNILMSRYMDMLYEHGVYPNFDTIPEINMATGSVTFTPKYINDVRKFVDKYGAGLLYISSNHFNDNYDEKGNNPKLEKFLSDFHDFSSRHPELGHFFVPVDEPYTLEKALKIVNISRILDRSAPSIKLFVNGAWLRPYYREAGISNWQQLETAVEKACDIRSVYSDYANKKEEVVKIHSLLNQGKEVWICPGTTKWCIDRNVLSFRVPSWRSYILGSTGIFSWQTSLSNPPVDPWVNPVTHTYSDGRVANGGGLLIYPATSSRVGFSGPGGPVASMRLKIFRDSVEDYAYFKLLESLIGRTETAKLILPVVPDFKTLQNNLVYETHRQKIAALILKNLSKNEN